MKIQIGIVKDFNNHYGKIITSDSIYTFLHTDIEPNEKIENNDYVIFRGENINGVYKAFFIKFLAKNIEKINKDILTKVIMEG